MKHAIIITTLLFPCFAPPLLADKLILKNGNTLQGDITTDEHNYVIRAQGTTITLPKSKVKEWIKDVASKNGSPHSQNNAGSAKSDQTKTEDANQSTPARKGTNDLGLPPAAAGGKATATVSPPCCLDLSYFNSLRYACTQRPGFDPYKFRSIPERETVLAAAKARQHKRVIELATRWLLECPGDADLRYVRAFSSYLLGDLQGAIHDLHFVAGTLHAIADSGTGTTQSTPFRVFSQAEAGWFMYLLLRDGNLLDSENVDLPSGEQVFLLKWQLSSKKVVKQYFTLTQSNMEPKGVRCPYCSPNAPSSKAVRLASSGVGPFAEVSNLIRLRMTYRESDTSGETIKLIATILSYQLEQSPEIAKRVVDCSAKLTAILPADSDIHRTVAEAAAQLGDVRRAAHHFHQAFGLSHTVVASGDGLSPRTAFKIVGTEELKPLFYARWVLPFHDTESLDLGGTTRGRIRWRSTAGATLTHYYAVGGRSFQSGMVRTDSTKSTCHLCTHHPLYGKGDGMTNSNIDNKKLVSKKSKAEKDLNGTYGGGEGDGKGDAVAITVNEDALVDTVYNIIIVWIEKHYPNCQINKITNNLDHDSFYCKANITLIDGTKKDVWFDASKWFSRLGKQPSAISHDILEFSARKSAMLARDPNSHPAL